MNSIPMIGHDMHINGYVDNISNSEINGWVFDVQNPHEPLIIEVLINGVVSGSALANRSRNDLKELGYPDCAFMIKLSRSAEIMKSKTILIRVRGSSRPLILLVYPDAISPKDGMYQGNLAHYMSVGAEAIDLMLQTIHDKSKIKYILDLPCGYGRVTRHLSIEFPEAVIYASDLIRDAVDFCVKKFGAIGVYSNEDLNINFDKKFDLIWVGSLATHISEVKTKKLLQLIKENLNAEGYAFITVHGTACISRLKSNSYGSLKRDFNSMLGDLETSGHAFSEYENSEDYGISLTSNGWFKKYSDENHELSLCHYSESSWDNHHDVVIFQKVD